MDLSGSNEAITEEYVKHCEKTNSNDIMYTTYDLTGNWAHDRVTNEFTELDAYYTGLTDTSKEVKKWGLGKSHYLK